jgi:FtsP/CotA-like multicopper oxidase with cupredoxin domain
VLYNNSMMRHPMHLHGHDFRVINGKEEYAIKKRLGYYANGNRYDRI